MKQPEQLIDIPIGNELYYMTYLPNNNPEVAGVISCRIGFHCTTEAITLRRITLARDSYTVVHLALEVFMNHFKCTEAPRESEEIEELWKDKIVDWITRVCQWDKGFTCKICGGKYVKNHYVSWKENICVDCKADQDGEKK